MKSTDNHRPDEENRLDDLFRDGLKDYRPKPSRQIWKGIDRKLLMRELIRFNFTNLSRTLWIGGAAIIVMTGVILIFTIPGRKEVPQAPVLVNEQIHQQKPAEPAPTITSQSKPGSETKGSTIRHQEETPSYSEKIIQSSTKQQKGNKEISNPEKPLNPQSAKVQPIALSTLITRTRTVSKATEKTENFTPSSNNNIPVPITPSAKSEKSEKIEILGLRSLKASINDLGQPGPNSLQPVDSNTMPELKLIRVPLPSYFSLGLGIAPEISFYKTSSSYNNYDYWLGLDFAYHIGRFYIKPGIGWGMVNDQGNWMVSYKRQDSIGFYYHVTSYAIDPLDPSKVIYHYTAQTILDSVNHVGNEKASNRYQYFQVPLLLGFNLVETPRFILAIQAGPGVSLLVSQKETHVELIQLTSSTETKRINQTPSRVTLNWQLWAGLHMEYRIKQMLGIMVEPTFKYYLAPVSENSSTPAKSPWVIGINLGLQYNFGFKNSKK